MVRVLHRRCTVVTAPTPKSYLDIFCEEPFRLFFLLGILFGCAGVSHWLFYDLGWIAKYSKFLHGAVQIQCFMMAFAVGFLLTALPRFMGAQPPSRREFLAAVSFLCVSMAAVSLEWWRLANASFILLIGVIVLFAVRRFPARTATPPKEFVFVPFGLAHGLIGAVLQILYWSGLAGSVWFQLGWLMITQGMFLCFILGIGGFLAPRLMGHASLPIVASGALRAVGTGPARTYVHAVVGVMLLASFVLEAQGKILGGQVLRAVVVSGELLWNTRCYKFPVVKDPYVRLLWISLWMVLLGLWAQVALPSHRIAALHVLFIGGFSLMALSIGTRVTLSHLGYSHMLNKPIGAITLLGLLFLLALTFRLHADLTPGWYFHFLSIAALVWMAGALAWFLFVLPKMLRKGPSPVESVRCS